MPTVTFMNLSQEKKDKIIKAAKKEFSRVPISEVLIKNIVEEAEIARGSFYQYFESKEDLLKFLLTEEMEKVDEVAIRILEETSGDIFEVYIGMYDFFMNHNINEEDKKFHKKVLENVRTSDESFYILKNFMNEEIKGNNFTEIPSETIQEWDNEFGFTYKGLYTNDVLRMLRTECFDKEFMEDFFGTKKPDELVQRKFEFVMKYIGIIKANQNRRLGNVEATRYYLKLSESILSKQEMNHYIELCIGFIEERKRRKAKNIAIIKKEKENVYYLYNSDKQIYEKIEKKELIKQRIQYYSFKRDKDVPIETFIKEKEQELIERMKKHSEDIEL